MRAGRKLPSTATPRPLKDIEGLSTYETLEQSPVKPGDWYVRIDAQKVRQSGLSTVRDASPPGHVTIRPGDQLTPDVVQDIADWAATRPAVTADRTAPLHPYTRAVLDAIIEEVRRPK